MPGFETGAAATEKVGLTISQVSIWSDVAGSPLLARDTGLLKSKAASNCSETLACGEFPRPFFFHSLELAQPVPMSIVNTS